MRLHAIKLNLALSFEAYTYIAKLCNLSIDSGGDKNFKSTILSPLNHMLYPIVILAYKYRIYKYRILVRYF